MNKLMKFFKKMLKPSTYEDCLNAIKTKYGAIGEPIYREPGVMVFQKKGSNDILRISFNSLGKKSRSKNCTLNVDTLLPMDTTYQQYISKVGEKMGFTKCRREVGPHYMVDGYPIVLAKVSPERFANRCGEGGLSRMYTYNNRQYFCPSTQCVI